MLLGGRLSFLPLSIVNISDIGHSNNDNHMKQPLKFLPYFRNTIWGGDEISRFKQISVNCRNIGESWELSAVPGCESIVSEGADMGLTLNDLTAKYGETLVGPRVYERYGNRFPLTIRLIDANEDIPLDTLRDHTPADTASDSACNVSLWYILNATDGAMIYTDGAYDTEEFMSGAAGKAKPNADGRLETHPGDSFLMPARYVKTIGAGNFLVEIQQACDSGNVDMNDINVKYEEVTGSRVFSNPEQSLMSLVCLKGTGRLKVSNVLTTVQQGETILIPAAADSFEVEGDLSLLKVAI